MSRPNDRDARPPAKLAGEALALHRRWCASLKPGADGIPVPSPDAERVALAYCEAAKRYSPKRPRITRRVAREKRAS